MTIGTIKNTYPGIEIKSKILDLKDFFPKLSIVFQSANDTNESEMRRICNCVQ